MQLVYFVPGHKNIHLEFIGRLSYLIYIKILTAYLLFRLLLLEHDKDNRLS